MDLKAFDAHCATYPGATMVVQWGNAHVWKVGEKVFAIASLWGKGVDEYCPTFKASDLSYRMLTEQEGIVSAPYLGRYKWVQVQKPEALSDGDLKAYIAQSYDIVSSKLTKAKRKELGLS